MHLREENDFSEDEDHLYVVGIVLIRQFSWAGAKRLLNEFCIQHGWERYGLIE